ncbi:MAG: NnrS family protein [Halioglobus sp.]
MNISEPRQQATEAPLWRLAFRGGFLFASVFAVIAMVRWLGWMVYPSWWNTDIPPHWWHAHEMIFGFAMPVVAGFLLSAVANWTGLPGTRGTPLKILFGLWLLARVTLVLLPQWLMVAWVAEMLFIAVLARELGMRVWQKRQWRNMLFLPVLIALASLSTASYSTVDSPLASTRLHYGALWMIVVLVVIIGGRVIPMFTGNRLGIKISPLPAWFEYTAIASTAVVAIAAATVPHTYTGNALPILYGLCSALHFYRLAHWRGWLTRSVPLLWSMHLSYLAIPVTLGVLALSGGDPVSSKNLMHLLGIGTVGGMIISMMSRVSLGHTGRTLDTPAGIAAAFALVLLAALLRALLPQFYPELTMMAWRGSALLWIVAFAIFVYRYYPILTGPRADGKPG